MVQPCFEDFQNEILLPSYTMRSNIQHKLTNLNGEIDNFPIRQSKHQHKFSYMNVLTFDSVVSVSKGNVSGNLIVTRTYFNPISTSISLEPTNAHGVWELNSLNKHKLWVASSKWIKLELSNSGLVILILFNPLHIGRDKDFRHSKVEQTCWGNPWGMYAQFRYL